MPAWEGVRKQLGLPATTGAPFIPPPLTSMKFDGDSRTANSAARSVGGSQLTASNSYGTGYGAIGLVLAVLGNKILADEGSSHGIGASSTLGMFYRQGTNSIDTVGNPANTTTGLATDVEYSVNSDGVYSVLTQPGKHVFCLCSVNDTGAWANGPFTASVSIPVIASYLDNCIAAGKTVYLANELPRGDSYYQMEVHSPVAGVSTVTNTTNFVDGDSFNDIGMIGWAGTGNLPVPLTKVISAPGQNQYTLSGATFTQGGTPLTTVWNNYNATPGGGRINNTAQGKVMHEWFNSTASNFVSSSGNSYGFPGCQYKRPQVRVFDSWTALLDPAHAGGSNIPRPGTFDIIQLHPDMYGAYLYAKALKAKFDADYPAATSLEQRPIFNNWYVARGTGLTTSYSGTLPPSMRIAQAGLVSVNGAPIGKFNAAGTITGTGISSGTINFTTGVWAITTTGNSVFANGVQVWFEQDIGNYDLVNMVEGTIGRNALLNGMMDTTAASGTNLPATTGTSTVTGITAAQIPYGWAFTAGGLNTAIAAANAAITVTSETWGDGYPRLVIQIEGIHTGAMNIQLQSSTVNTPLARLLQARVQSGARQMYAKHLTNGHLYGTISNNITAALGTTAIARLAAGNPSANQNVTILATRTIDGTTGLFISDVLYNASGGQTDLYRLAPLVGVSGYSGGTTTLTFLITNTNNIPMAIRYGLGQAQLRTRSDI